MFFFHHKQGCIVIFFSYFISRCDRVALLPIHRVYVYVALVVRVKVSSMYFELDWVIMVTIDLSDSPAVTGNER